MSDLDDFLRSRPDRCAHCGWHPSTQGHSAACALGGNAPRKPTDPMTAARTGESMEAPRVIPDVLESPPGVPNVPAVLPEYVVPAADLPPIEERPW
jgi:hypothetical protein